MTTQITVREALERTADLLETTGWCQRAFSIYTDGRRGDSMGANGQVAYCVSGGVSHVCHEAFGWPTNDYSNVSMACLQAIREEATKAAGYAVAALGTWNDHPDQTAANVIATVRAAARNLEEVRECTR